MIPDGNYCSIRVLCSVSDYQIRRTEYVDNLTDPCAPLPHMYILVHITPTHALKITPQQINSTTPPTLVLLPILRCMHTCLIPTTYYPYILIEGQVLLEKAVCCPSSTIVYSMYKVFLSFLLCLNLSSACNPSIVLVIRSEPFASLI